MLVKEWKVAEDQRFVNEITDSILGLYPFTGAAPYRRKNKLCAIQNEINEYSKSAKSNCHKRVVLKEITRHN